MTPSTGKRRKMHSLIRGTDAERFWPKVQKTDGCWLWMAGIRQGFGYGQFARKDHSPANAHRVSYELTYGAIPDGLWVLHRCDNPRCVRPDHLFLGTAADNALDCILKGRRSVKKHTCKLPFGWPKDGLRTHCKYGHEFTPENTYHHARRDRRGSMRGCRICRRMAKRKSRAA